jgi:hypothetical protein
MLYALGALRALRGLLNPKLSDSSGQHESRQHHACHSESAVGGRRIFWVESTSEILRRPPEAGLLRMTVNGESLILG